VAIALALLLVITGSLQQALDHYAHDLISRHGHQGGGTSGGVITTYQVDAADQLTALLDNTNTIIQSYSYDANGNRTGVGADTYAYDWRNRMISATVGATPIAYAYTPDDLRSSRDAGSGAMPYLWDRAADLPALVGDGQTIYLPQGRLGSLVQIDSASGADTYPLVDALGSIRATTDDTGTVIGAADWDVWGNQIAASGQQSGQAWTGELRDPATGLTYLRARDYSPGTARFTSRDSLSPNGSGTLAYEPYGYADLNPATFVDPTGHQAMAGTMTFARCVICTPVRLEIMMQFVARAQALAAAAPVALRSGIAGANRWAIAGLVLVAAILTCLALPACHQAVPQVIEETGEVVEDAAEAAVELIVMVVGEIRTFYDPAPEPEPEPKRVPESPLPPQPDSEPDREDKKCRLKSITWWNFDYNLACDTGKNWQTRPYGPPNTQAHHVFPRAFQEPFDQILGFSANHRPIFGQWWSTVDPPTHQGSSSAYNREWRGFFASYRPGLPGYGETLRFGGVVMGDFQQQVRYPT
jgi:RHS repeat-associated protein